MKRVFKVVLGLFVVVLIAIVLILNSFGGKVIRQTVNTVGPAALGVPVTLEEAHFQLLRGHIRLKGLKVGNPDGFKTDSLFDLGELTVNINTRSLLSGLVHIREIAILDPKITYERGLTSSNLGDLMASLESEEAPAEAPVEEKKAEPEPEEAGGAKVVIDEISIKGAQLKVSLTVAQGFSAPLPLPPIILRDIGKDSAGVSFMEVIRMVLRAILGSVTGVLSGSVELLGDGAKAVGQGAVAVGGAAVDGAVAVGGAAVDGAKAVGQGAAVVGGAAVDGAVAVGGAAVGGVKAVGKGVGAVGGAVVGGIGGLFGGGDKDKDPEPASTNAAAGSVE